VPKLCAVIGDLHGSILDCVNKLQAWERRCDQSISFCLQVGDLGITSSRDVSSDFWRYKEKIWTMPFPFYCLRGNHECAMEVLHWSRNPNMIDNLYLLPDGRITEIQGIRIAALHGCFSPKSYADPSRVRFHRSDKGNSEKIAGHILKDSVDSLLTHDSCNILITHDASAKLLPAAYRRQLDVDTKLTLGLEKNELSGGCPGIDTILERLHPSYYYYGHLHCNSYSMHNETKVRCLQAIQYDSDFFDVIQLP
jgi:predicted phosphodiesterase